jgi:hypothetical protein
MENHARKRMLAICRIAVSSDRKLIISSLDGPTYGFRCLGGRTGGDKMSGLQPRNPRRIFGNSIAERVEELAHA